MNGLKMSGGSVQIELDEDAGEMLIRITKEDLCKVKGAGDVKLDAVCESNCRVGGAIVCKRDNFNYVARALRDTFDKLNKPTVIMVNDCILMKCDGGHTIPFFGFWEGLSFNSLVPKLPSDSSAQGAARTGMSELNKYDENRESIVMIDDFLSWLSDRDYVMKEVIDLTDTLDVSESNIQLIQEYFDIDTWKLEAERKSLFESAQVTA